MSSLCGHEDTDVVAADSCDAAAEVGARRHDGSARRESKSARRANVRDAKRKADSRARRQAADAAPPAPARVSDWTGEQASLGRAVAAVSGGGLVGRIAIRRGGDGHLHAATFARAASGGYTADFGEGLEQLTLEDAMRCSTRQVPGALPRRAGAHARRLTAPKAQQEGAGEHVVPAEPDGAVGRRDPQQVPGAQPRSAVADVDANGGQRTPPHPDRRHGIPPTVDTAYHHTHRYVTHTRRQTTTQ